MRKNNKMTLQDRLTIKRMYYEGKSFREIGKAIGYSHTAVANEIKRNGRMLQPKANNLRRTKGRVYHYNAYETHKAANMRKAKTLINDIISISSLNKLTHYLGQEIEHYHYIDTTINIIHFQLSYCGNIIVSEKCDLHNLIIKRTKFYNLVLLYVCYLRLRLITIRAKLAITRIIALLSPTFTPVGICGVTIGSGMFGG